MRKTTPQILDIWNNPFTRLRLALMLGLFILAVGTGGYMVIEKYSFLDAIYMCVITLGTVGYGEVHPLDTAGRIFTIFLILGGLGTAAWVFTTIIEVFVSEESLQIIARKRMDRIVGALSKHHIICGFGRIGQQIAQNYTDNKIDFLVIEREPARVEMLREAGIPYVVGDAADDLTLQRAGIDRAASLIAVTPTDAVNTFIVLSARGLRADLYIVARADAIQNEAKLRRAGASKVVSPHTLGGRWMGITAINPAVTDFILAMTDADHSQFRLSEFTVTNVSPLKGKKYGETQIRTKTGALVVAVRRVGQSQQFLPNPPDDLILATGDVLIAIGSPVQLVRLSALLSDHP